LIHAQTYPISTLMGQKFLFSLYFFKSCIMKRTRVSELLTGVLIGSEVIVKGWVKAFRQNRFLMINDGSSVNNIQAVVDFENFPEDLIRKITIASAVSVMGKLVESQGKGQAAEIIVESVEVLGTANPDEVQETILQPKRHSLDTLREQAHLRFR